MQAWEQFLQSQEDEIGIEPVKKWLRTLKIIKFDACNLYLEAKDSFQTLWFEEHMRNKVQTKLFNPNNKRIKIHLTTANSPKSIKKSNKNKKKEEASSFKLTTFDKLDPHCTFERFIVSEDNLLTYKLLAEQIESFNPIYIYGKEGVGKTHLLMSLSNSFQKKGLKTIFVRAETFTDHVVTAIRAGEMSVFRQAYRNIDVLLVDDVHIFSRKGATQEEFFHTFNTLHLEGKQIILAANCAPQELQLIEPRLVSRFEWGIVLPLKPLHRQEMVQLLKIKAESLNFPLPDPIITFFIDTFSKNPKSLVKALEAIILRLHLDSNHTVHNLTLTAVKILLADLIIEEQKLNLSSSKIIEAVAEQYGIPIEDILSKAQTRDCTIPRQLAMYLCREELKLPFMKIGELFSRDHSTVMSGVKQMKKALDQNQKELAHMYYGVMKKLQSSF